MHRDKTIYEFTLLYDTLLYLSWSYKSNNFDLWPW